MSKKDQAQKIYDHYNRTMSRSDIIAMFISTIGMTQACANTYYANCKKASTNNVDHNFQAKTTIQVEKSSTKVVEDWMQIAIDKHNSVCRLAERVYGVDLSKVNVTFDLKGKSAGRAGVRGNFFDRKYYIQYNPQAMQHDSNHGINNTIPHEIAHIVCFMNPKLGRNHDFGWKTVCERLGGNGERCHDLTLTNGKKTTKYLYNVEGVDIRIGAKVHNKIQNGCTTYRLKANKATVLHHHFVSKIEN